MMLCFWLFVFGVHFAQTSSRSTASHQSGFQSAYQNAVYRSTAHRNALRSDALNGVDRSVRPESRWKRRPDTPVSASSSGQSDQLLAESSEDDPAVEPTPDSSDHAYSAFSYHKKKEHPYSFGFHSNDGWGTKVYRSEKKLGKVVTGSYGYIDNQGLYRFVTYEADKNGFRAKIKSNEPGLASKNPAHVEMDAKPMHLPTKADNRRYRNDYKSKASDLVSKFSKHSEPYHETTIRTIKRQLKLPTINSADDYADNLNAEPQNADESRNGRSLNGAARDAGRDGFAGANSGNLNDDRLAGHQFVSRRRVNVDASSADHFGGSRDEGSFINHLNKDHDDEDNLINSTPTKEPHADAPGTSSIRHWNEEAAASEPLSDAKANEQSDQTDEQQDDEENYQINRKTVYRARL